MTNHRFYATLNSERRWNYEENTNDLVFAYLNFYTILLSSKLVWQSVRCPVVYCCRSRFYSVCGFIRLYDNKNIRMSKMQNRIQAEMVSAVYHDPFQRFSHGKMSTLRQKGLLQKKRLTTFPIILPKHFFEVLFALVTLPLPMEGTFSFLLTKAGFGDTMIKKCYVTQEE